MDDRVTVFVPVRHFHDAFLREALASVQAQTRTDWTMIVVVHPASEATIAHTLRPFVEDPRVHVVRSEGRNLAGAYNTAMRHARTEFLTVLLGDDMLAADCIEVLGDAIRARPDADFFHSGRYFVDEAGTRISADYLPDRPVMRESFVVVSPVKHLMCWRVSRGIACGGVDEALDNFGTDDYDFPWTMLEHGATFHAIPRALYIYRDHREAYRLTTHLPRNRQADTLRRILVKHGVPGPEVQRIMRAAKRGYLKQSLFRNRVHRWLSELTGVDPRRGWKERYR